MATFYPSSGAIDLSSVNTLFGRGTAISNYTGTTYYTSTGGPFTFPSSNFGFNAFYGTGPSPNRVSLSYTFTSNTANASLNLSSIGGYSAGNSDITVAVNGGVYLYSTSTSTPGLTISGGTTGDTLTIKNNGYILGCGGVGGAGVFSTTAGSGANGGPALSLSIQATINNTNTGAYIGGGGAGGGAGGGGQGTIVKNTVVLAGGGGGGGAGGGAGGNCAGQQGSQTGSFGPYSGGAGGGAGQAGQGGQGYQATGYVLPTGGGAGGGGGAQSQAGAGGGRIIPGSGGIGGQSAYTNPQTGQVTSIYGGNGGSSNQAGQGGGAGFLAQGNGGGGGGWGAAGGGGSANPDTAITAYAPGSGGSGGNAVQLNGHSVTWVSGVTQNVYGAVS